MHRSFYHSYAGFRLACRLPLCRVIIACCFRVAALSGNAALALSPSGIAPELNRIQLSAIGLLAWRCLPLGHPSAASGACAVVQISSLKRQCGKWQVSLKPALYALLHSPCSITVNGRGTLRNGGFSNSLHPGLTLLYIRTLTSFSVPCANMNKEWDPEIKGSYFQWQYSRLLNRFIRIGRVIL